jgi:hypothetical protein
MAEDAALISTYRSSRIIKQAIVRKKSGKVVRGLRSSANLQKLKGQQRRLFEEFHMASNR